MVRPCAERRNWVVNGGLFCGGMWFGTQAAFSQAVQKAVQAAIGPQLTRIEAALNALKGSVMPTLDDVLTEVTRNTSVTQSAVTLLQSLGQQLQAALANGDTAKVQQILSAMQANDNSLAAAITANTPAAPAPSGGPAS